VYEGAPGPAVAVGERVVGLELCMGYGRLNFGQPAVRPLATDQP
jgi:hypothetical protein